MVQRNPSRKGYFRGDLLAPPGNGCIHGSKKPQQEGILQRRLAGTPGQWMHPVFTRCTMLGD